MRDSRIVFVITLDGKMDVWSMDADGRGHRNLTRTPNWEEDHPNWSPEGSIVFCSRRHGRGEIYTMECNGENSVRITHNDYPDLRPHFSGDSKKILFASDRCGQADMYDEPRRY